jgi:hypothetical protein
MFGSTGRYISIQAVESQVVLAFKSVKVNVRDVWEEEQEITPVARPQQVEESNFKIREVIRNIK